MLDATATVNSELSYGLFTKKRIQPTLVTAGPQPVISTFIGLAGGNSDGNPPSTKSKPNALAGQIYLVEQLKKQESFPKIFQYQ